MADQPRAVDDGGEPAAYYAYFMIRLERRDGHDRADTAGVVERLGNGEKRRFSGAHELLALLAAWSDPPAPSPNMSRGLTRGKPTG